jgi:hypothetical protein
MKKMLLLLVASMLLAWPLSAQWVFNGFESAVKDSMFSYATTASAKKNIHINVDTATGVQGSKAMKCTWTVHTTESWGGFNQLNFFVPRSKDNTYYANTHRAVYKDSTYMNFTGAKYISLWFNNLVKSSANSVVHFRLELYEAGGTTNNDYWNVPAQHEEWYFEDSTMYYATAGWKQMIMPLVDRGGGGVTPNDKGFSDPGWSGITNNGKLDLDKIVGYSIVWTATLLGGDSTASGVIMFDKLQLLGDNSTPIRTFNNFAQDTTDFGPYIGKNDAGSITFFKETADTLISPSALGVDWKVNGAQSWGGYANFEYVLPASTYFTNLAGNAYLQLYIKVVKPLTSSTGTIQNKVTMRLTLKETGTSNTDEWYTKLNVIIDSTANDLGWQQVTMPLLSLSGSWAELSSKGFYNVVPPTSGSNGIMDLNQLGRIKFEFSMSADAPEPTGATLFYSGKILISKLVPAGVRETDVTPPAKVTGVVATPGTFTNLITWADVLDEPLSTYNVYVSEKSFSSVTEKGVENVPPFNLPLATQSANHLLRAPVTDQSITYYYGVTATDHAGNTNQPTIIGPITNTAKGVPTIAKAPPANIAIDGNLAEWSEISPIVVNSFRNPKTAHIAPNGTLRDSNDLSVKAYLAVDAENLYVAFDVVDDTVTVDTLKNDWEQDCPDLFIGLYDWRGPKHSGYTTGATPEYHFRFSQNRIREDKRGPIIMYQGPGTNYVWKKKALTSGYTLEAKIPFPLLKQRFPADNAFVWLEGMRIPIDIEINDRDGLPVLRDCELCYSTLNEDNSYIDMWHWTHTWIGAQWVVGVSDKDGATANTYELLQNYPNPFNPATTIKYQLAKPGQTTLKVYDVLGREVMTLVNENQETGSHSVQFNGTALASGIYIYRIQSGSFVDVKKMLFLK